MKVLIATLTRIYPKLKKFKDKILKKFIKFLNKMEPLKWLILNQSRLKRSQLILMLKTICQEERNMLAQSVARNSKKYNN